MLNVKFGLRKDIELFCLPVHEAQICKIWNRDLISINHAEDKRQK
jgi:hypothetical protein